ncbi:cupin domain-containing protein [Aerophototrophica crusticola]|uniref:Cupin domain-containing protein n=1 Tax=Aerophototrophica crusticola TaxID=1709002 RepID=A0A858R615_9PROT|nr:cupin domain-containing protein [Rhodospirillaceae bacterium B3]
MDTVNIAAKLAQIGDHWNPRIIGEVNDFQVKAVKLRGAFDWHHHVEEDELFLVVKGTLTMNFRDRTATVGPGEFIVVPHGVEHQPVAEQEVEILLFERATTLNTGTERTARTREQLERL